MPKNIREFFQSVGGTPMIVSDMAKVRAKEGKAPLHEYSIQRWARIGIPLEHWPHLIHLYDLNPTIIYNLNLSAKKK